MSQTTIHLEVPDNLMQAAMQSGAREGKSLQQWAQSALEERVRLERSAEEFFRKHTADATGEDLRWAGQRPRPSSRPRRRTRGLS